MLQIFCLLIFSYYFNKIFIILKTNINTPASILEKKSNTNELLSAKVETGTPITAVIIKKNLIYDNFSLYISLSIGTFSIPALLLYLRDQVSKGSILYSCPSINIDINPKKIE